MISRAGIVFRQENGSVHNGAIFNGKKDIDADQQPSSQVVTEPVPKTLEELAQRSPRVLCEVKNVFPFVLFQDEVVVDESKVTFIIGRFIESKEVRSVMIKDVSNIQVETSYFFARIQLTDRNFVNDPLVVKYVKKNDAYALRRIIVGLMIAHENGVELSDYDDKDLIENLEKIGSARDVENQVDDKESK